MLPLSWPEIVLFLVLVAISAYLFWTRFGKVWKRIMASKDDPDFKLQPLGKRVSKFVWEVLLQGQVIQQRPLPGLAHAFVFWGFCAFALITLNHLVAGFGLRLLSPSGGFGRFYFAFVAFWAIAVAISIAGLFVRRFLVRPKWLGPVSPESGFIALLIFVLLITYLLGLRLPENELAGRINWWLHT